MVQASIQGTGKVLPPSVSGNHGNRNTQASNAKSLNSTSKGQSSTSQSHGNKTPVTNAVNVLSFLTNNEKGISSLPRIPKISSSSANANKTATTTATTVTTVTSISSITTAAKMVYSSQNSFTTAALGRPTYSSGGSYSTANKSPIASTGKSPLQGTFNNQAKNLTPQGNVKQTSGSYNSPSNRSPNLSNNIGSNRPNITGGSSNFNAAKHLGLNNSASSVAKLHTGAAVNSSTGPNRVTANTSSPVSKPSSSVNAHANPSRPVNVNPRILGVKSSPITSSASSNKTAVSSLTTTVVTTVSSKTTTSVSSASDVQRRPSVSTSVVTTSVSTSVNVSSVGSGTVHSGGANAIVVGKSKSRKNSLSAVIDKLTSAKSNASSEGEERKNKLEHNDSLEEVDSAFCDSQNKSSDSELNERLSHRVEDSGGKNVSSAKSESSESFNKSNSVKSFTGSAAGETAEKQQTGYKDAKGETSSRNLFTSIMKNASGNFTTENFKDDKENSLQIPKSDSAFHREENACSEISRKSQSPKPSPKLNGPVNELSDGAKKTESDKDVFKVPTPKTDDKNSEDTENMVVRRKARISTSKPALSPASPASSPENLIIDFQTPVSPRTLQNRTNSPHVNIEIPCPDDGKRLNNSNVKVCKVISSPLQKTRPSPVASPIIQNMQLNPSPPLNNSPMTDVADIDDDLMNEAIMGYGE